MRKRFVLGAREEYESPLPWRAALVHPTDLRVSTAGGARDRNQEIGETLQRPRVTEAVGG